MSHQARGETLPGGSPGPSSGAQCTKPKQQQLTLGTWNVTTLKDKETELVRQVERYKLDLVGLTSTHSHRTGAKTLDRGWTLFFSGVAEGVRRQTGVGILINPRLRTSWLEFTPVDERVVSLRLRVMGEEKNMTVVCAYAPNIDKEYPAFLETLKEVLSKVPEEDYVVLLGDFNAHVGQNAFKWPSVIGEYGHHDENLSGRRLLKFCAEYELSITNTMFQHTADDKFTWYNLKKFQKSMIDFVIVSSNLWPHVLETCVETEAELNTDHRLVVSRIWPSRTLDEPGYEDDLAGNFRRLGVSKHLKEAETKEK